MLRGHLRRAIAGGALVFAACRRTAPADAFANPHPVVLRRPAVLPLSEAAMIGALVFRDTTLSASGHLACVTCHDPAHAFAPANAMAVQRGGNGGLTEGRRAVPSLRYASRFTSFSIGPDDEIRESVDLHALASQATSTARATKIAEAVAVPAMVPQGGLFWDGRANTLQDQAMGPLFDPAEMANDDVAMVAGRLRAAPYYPRLLRLFGRDALRTATQLVDEALFTVARYQVEDSLFHPYNSRYDRYLEGKGRLSGAELRGLRAFDDTARGNCAACHLDRPLADGTPPPFTDGQYEALGVPRNALLASSRDAGYFDLGVCGPIRHDLAREQQYCAMFRTPTLRNVATRQVFFHNGVYRSLEQVLAFYNFRDTRPDSIYPSIGGIVSTFDDLPARYRANVDIVDPPFTHHRGDPPPMSRDEMRDIVAFLRTLTDQ